MSLNYRAPDYSEVIAARAKKLNRFRHELSPDERAGVLAYYRDHPIDFINDWGMTYDPRNGANGQPNTVPFVLFPKQAEFVTWVYDRFNTGSDGLGEKSRDMGVSWLTVAIAVHMWLFQKEATIGFGSRKEVYVDDLGDPKSLFWKVRFFIRNLPREFKPKGWDEKRFAPLMKITNPENNSVIVGEAGDNIGRGARASIYFVDEFAFIERADHVDSSLSQCSNCKIFVSTPNGSGNMFYRKRHEGRMPVFTFHWTDDPRKGPDWYAKQKRELDPVVLAQEVDIDYAASVDNAFIDGALVEDAFLHGPADVLPIGNRILGVDPAHFGPDNSVITFRHGRLVLPQWVIKGKVDGPNLAGRICEIADDLGDIDQIVIEKTGAGTSCYDAMKRTRYRDKVIGVDPGGKRKDGKNYNHKALWWRRLQEWLKDGPVVLPRDGDLKTELTATQYDYRDGLLLMEPKADFKSRVGRSPDRADSLALTFAAFDAPPVTAVSSKTNRYHGDGSWLA